MASGFTLIFGLMRNVNLAHGSLYLLGGYLGYEVADRDRLSGCSPSVVVFVVVGLLGLLMQRFVFRRMEGEDLRQTLVSIGISIVLADLMLWIWGGQSYTILTPDWLTGPMNAAGHLRRSSATARWSICAIRWCASPSWSRRSSSAC